MSSDFPNILASRYASSSIKDIWSDHYRVVLERLTWIAVLKSQKQLGIKIPQKAIDDYEAVVEQVDLASILSRESRLKHDVKARIEEFCCLAGHELIHEGMTSRDLTDNVEQWQVLKSLLHLQLKYVATLHALSTRARQWRELVIVGRTHHAAAQPTTLGRRLAMFGEEMLLAFRRLEDLLARYPFRGLRGAVGTGLDQLTLLEGDPQRYEQLNSEFLSHFGVDQGLNAVGQIYPRSVDFEVVSCLFQLGSGISSLAKTLRLMAGGEMVTEGFSKGQVGSSAMPHKMNTRSLERINGLQAILGGHVHMIGALAGDQWFEGDVSCSVVRRVVLPDSIFAFDGLLETALHVLYDMGVYEKVIQSELDRFLPFLATTTLLMESVRRGAGREQAHEAIKEHAVAAALSMRERGLADNDLARRLGEDERLPLTTVEIQGMLEKGESFVGMAVEQTRGFEAEVSMLVDRFPDAKEIVKSPIL
jgi:adenylosuccinate lyase